ncbi:unnamed protein product [Trichogramma brassicae]|uniref:Uncharacterized protein n=1 Tax=Trichogramma brassicae TaxID=86971 RepID=A0A6H5ICQ8_9HYME|nr:unnamed protein product [Trichogramma brassicae]
MQAFMRNKGRNRTTVSVKFQLMIGIFQVQSRKPFDKYVGAHSSPTSMLVLTALRQVCWCSQPFDKYVAAHSLPFFSLEIYQIRNYAHHVS